MRIQIFPMMATLSRLQELCDQQFNNVIPPSVAIFRPALPMVFCGILHYPDMTGQIAYQTGTMSQNEMYFLVPLERYRLINGKEEFVELGATTAYIFVDNAESVAAARERFGMPKELAQFSTDFSTLPWDVGSQRYLRIGAWEPSANGVCVGPLLEVTYSTPSLDPTVLRDNDVTRPTTGAGPLEWLKLAEDTRTLLGRQFDSATIDGMVNRLKAYAGLLSSSQQVSLFSLRQFADPTDPQRARYSDLIAFRMSVVDVQALGFLGQGPLASQFQLHLRQSDLRPIAKTLGLRVSQRTTAHLNGLLDSFDAIDALLPFYTQTDTDLMSVERLCWQHDRGHGAPWRDETGKALGPSFPGVFNTFLGQSGAAFLQPQAQLPTLDLKYLMVAARRATLGRLIQRMLPSDSPLRITVAGNHPEVAALRLLFTRSRPGPWRHRGELMWNDGTYLSIAIPVIAESATGKLEANFMLQELADNPFTVQSMRAMLGEPTNHATFKDGKGGWFSSTHDLTCELSVSVMGIDRTANGAALVNSPLLDVLTAESDDVGAMCLTPDALHDLRENLWPRIGAVLPSISVGHVPSPRDPTKSILDRLMISYFREDTVQPIPPRAEIGGRQHVLRLYGNELYPIARQTGLLALDDDCELGSKIVRLGAIGDCDSIPVIAAAEGVSQIRLENFEILSESGPDWRAPRP